MEVGFLGRVFASLVDEQGPAEELSDLFELGVALFGLGVMTGIAAGVLAIILLVFLVSPSTRGENSTVRTLSKVQSQQGYDSP